jgi:hypothetical protein
MKCVTCITLLVLVGIMSGCTVRADAQSYNYCPNPHDVCKTECTMFAGQQVCTTTCSHVCF